MTKVDLRDDGVLFMVNTVLFHPLGYALSVTTEGEFLLMGDGSERWTFFEQGEESADNDRLWSSFQDLLHRQSKEALFKGGS